MQALENRYNTALFYISDHGESLGEDGLFLHGIPYTFAPEYQTKVPMVLWTSNGYDTDKSLDKLCLKKLAKEKRFSHDNVFYSILGIVNVHAEVYNPRLDIFATCRY
ncbi:sulfatase-like hydrolase/transferase [Shewanella cutis]|uniref:Sulfatase-like hydrolase/transferase n=1 Tax=Shewanella cutis TaxID=2766780 RepID=A0ABS9R2S1_9GAMM|nr:sulfatase-like hydrolase/transferase [Shewanella sp. PS-2]